MAHLRTPGWARIVLVILAAIVFVALIMLVSVILAAIVFVALIMLVVKRLAAKHNSPLKKAS